MLDTMASIWALGHCVMKGFIANEEHQRKNGYHGQYDRKIGK